MRHLVIGGRGLIGTALCRELAERGADYIATTRREPREREIVLDLNGPIPPLPNADVVYLVAAKPGFSVCEGNQESWHINVDAPIAIARQAKQRNPAAHVVFISSDSVEWGGITAYARQKAHVETYINAIDGSIIRPPKVTNDRVRDFARFVVETGEKRKPGVFQWP